MAEIIDARDGGKDHAVLTVTTAGGQPYRREPCATCPWRVDAIGEFPSEAFRQAANVGIDASHLTWHRDPIGAAASIARADHTFACHGSGVERPATCAGYILRGDQALSWRLALSRGAFIPTDVRDGGHRLFENYRAMAEANGVRPDDPALIGCSPFDR